MPGKRKVRPCPQHEAGTCPKPVYLLRSCPACMKFLAEHPEAVKLVTFGVPGHRPYHPSQGALSNLW